MNGSKRQTENDQEFGLELSTCLPSRPIDWCVASGKPSRREDWYDKFGVQHASIGVAGRIKQAMDMDVARKMSVKILGSPDLPETIGLCRVFRGSLIRSTFFHVIPVATRCPDARMKRIANLIVSWADQSSSPLSSVVILAGLSTLLTGVFL